ncbi:MAG: DUF4271 domain-containing protein [Tannerella sp.]|jgi:hypothetical protein|nr:DUF4271 domain-containing protein [Tannerella sp.]
MNGNAFERFTVVPVSDLAHTGDVLFLIVIALLSVMAIVTRLNLGSPENLFKNGFLTVQTILLTGIFIFLASVCCSLVQMPDTVGYSLGLTVIFIVITLIYCLFKFGIYRWVNALFASKEQTEMFMRMYQKWFNIWGATLYIPVFCILLIKGSIFITCIYFIISYIAFRVIFLFRFFYIIYTKNTGILFFCLYLCSAEIAPLIFLYEGLTCLYNNIVISTLWQ